MATPIIFSKTCLSNISAKVTFKIFLKYYGMRTDQPKTVEVTEQDQGPGCLPAELRIHLFIVLWGMFQQRGQDSHFGREGNNRGVQDWAF